MIQLALKRFAIVLLVALITSLGLAYVNRYKSEVKGVVVERLKTDRRYFLSLHNQEDLELDSITYFKYAKIDKNKSNIYTIEPVYFFLVRTNINDEKGVKVSKEDYYKYSIGSKYSREAGIEIK